MEKKPKPQGHGHYVYCAECKGAGFVLNTRKYLGSKMNAPKNTVITATSCKECKGAGWTTTK